MRIGRIPVRSVRFEHVHPEQEPLGRVRLHPCNGLGRDGLARPLVEHATVGTTRHTVAVDVEAARKSEAGVEGKGADERARREAPSVEDGGQRRDRPHRDPVVSRAVPRWVQSGQEARVGGQCNGCGGKRAIEAHAPLRDRVERRRAGRPMAVRADVVGTQRVDGHHHDVASRRPTHAITRRRRVALPAPQARESPGRQGGDAHEQNSPSATTRSHAGPLYTGRLSLARAASGVGRARRHVPRTREPMFHLSGDVRYCPAP